jgi:hypothetical protein
LASGRWLPKRLSATSSERATPRLTRPPSVTASLPAPAAASSPASNASDGEDDDGSSQALWGWVVGGTGLVIGVVGIGLLGAARATSSSVHDIEPGTTSWDSDDARGRFETAQTEQSIGIVALVGGATLGLLGIVVVATAPSDPAVGVTAMVGPATAGLGLNGAF